MKNYFIYSIIAMLLISCNSHSQKDKDNLESKKSVAPIKVAEGQFVYHYTSQEHLDTLDYGFRLNNTERDYSFTLDNPNSDYAQDTLIEIWSPERIKKFENKIKNRSTFLDMTTREKMNFYEPSFSEYCKQGKMKDRLATVRDFSKKADAYDGNNVLVSSLNSFKNRAPLDYFMLYGNDSIKKETIKIILDRIPKIGASYFDDLAPLLIHETSTEYYKALLVVRKNIDTVKNKKKRLAQLQNYIEHIAPEVVRLGGKKAINDVLKTVDYIYRNDNSYYVMQHFSKHVTTVFRVLFRFHEIDPTTKSYINNRLKKYYIDTKTLTKNNNVYQLDIDTLVLRAKKLDLLKNNLSINQRYQVARNYCSIIGNTYTLDMSDFLKNIPVIFSYKSSHYSSGHLTVYNTPPYQSVMNKFMVTALIDLPDFYTETYLRKDSYGDPYNVLFLGNKEEGFVIKLKDKEAKDYNHEAIYYLFNTVLKHKNIEKQFTYKENESEHRYEAMYEKPNAINTFLKAAGYSKSDLDYD